ncbi:SIMPL domain-containing protein [Sphingomonas sp. LB-2]|nr:SIMPL domain-containing protein [Sphingomonas caeni]
MRLALLLLPFAIAALPSPALAQTGELPHGIVVTGSATIKTAPDRATISIELRGEGTTPDAATSDLAKRQRDVIGGLAQIDPKLKFYTGAVATSEVRKGDCPNTPGRYDLSEGSSTDDKGPCRVTGYVATISATVELTAVDKAGTAIGLAQRLGAASASLDGFSLQDPEAAERAAAGAAMADARAQAQTLATASGGRLGPIVSVIGTPNIGAPMEAGESLNALPQARSAPVSAPPVQIDVTPKPVETTARVTVVFSLAN